MPNYEYLLLSRRVSYTLKPGVVKQSTLETKWFWEDVPEDSRTMQERLNALGKEGWELVSAFPLAQRSGEGWSGMTSCVDLILKRTVESS
jgi:hypothetical protein